MNDVTVIIPNYNGKRFLKPCLDALRSQSARGFDIIVVDNGSTDGSAAFLKENYGETRLIELETNTGFCGAVNTGVTAAKTKYIILLNNDTVPDRDLIKNLVRAMDERPKAFSCSSKMLTLKDPEIIDGAGDLYNALGWAIARGKGQRAGKYTKPVRVFSACAGAAIYRRDLFVKLGMLDTNHFAYLEDMDIGWRARIQGYENWFIPDAKTLHVGSGSSGSRYNEFKVRLSARNNVYVIYKNMPVLQRVINTPFLFIGFVIKFFYFKRKGFGSLYKKSLKEGRALALSVKGQRKRFRHSGKYLGNYIKIQLELWVNMFKVK